MMCWLSPSPISRMAAASFSSRTADEVGVVGNAPPADNAPRAGQRAAGGHVRPPIVAASIAMTSTATYRARGTETSLRAAVQRQCEPECECQRQPQRERQWQRLLCRQLQRRTVMGWRCRGCGDGCCYRGGGEFCGKYADICCTAGDLSARIRLAAAVLIIKASGRSPRPPPQPILRSGNVRRL